MPKDKSQDEVEEITELEEPEVVEDPEPEVEDEPEVEEQPAADDPVINIDEIALVFDESTVSLWLSKAHVRLHEKVDSVLLVSRFLPEKQAQSILVWAIGAVRPGGLVVVPEVLMGSPYLEDLQYEGAVEDFFAFRK